MDNITTKICPLQKTTELTLTDYWNDSCSVEELTYAIERGAVGATSNPTIVLEVLKKEMPFWEDRIFQTIDQNPTWNEEQITWKLIEEMAVRGCELLDPVFQRENGLKGRLSIQTNPTYYRDAAAITMQAIYFTSLAPNIQVKIPVTKAGIKAIEDATFTGVNINATVCFTVPQAMAVAAAVERGLRRREEEGLTTELMRPVCTLMIGRLDDWMQVLIKRDKILVDPGIVHWAGIACLKKAYPIFVERGYRTRLLAAAYRHHLHWSELIGGDIVLTIPYSWQKQFNSSSIEIVERFSRPVPSELIEELYQNFPDFRRAYDLDGLAIEDFDTYGPTVRTLRSFISSYHDLISVIRDFMLPNPDNK
jgi:transaldolase